MIRKNFIVLLGIFFLTGCIQDVDLARLLVPTLDADSEKIRQQILLTPKVKGVADRMQKRKVLQVEKNQQEKQLEPLIKQLKGLSEEGILSLLGKPQRQLHQGNVLIWQYVTAQCQWDLYFIQQGGQRLTGISDLIIHQQGKIITDSEQIMSCDKVLRPQIVENQST